MQLLKQKTRKRKWKLPSSFVIIFGVIALLILLTWIPGMASKPMGIVDLFVVPWLGLKNNIELIGFILAIGAFLNVTVKSKALEASLQKLVAKMKGKEIWLIPICMTIFSIGGTTYGMAEETLAFYPILIPFFIAAGFDAMTAILVIMLGAGAGTLAATLDPFKIAIAVDTSIQTGISDITNSTGIIWRIICWVIILGIFTTFVWHYGQKVKKDPSKSTIYQRQQEFAKKYQISPQKIDLTRKRKIILTIFCSTFLLMIFGLIAWEKFGITIFGAFNQQVTNNAPYFSTLFNAFGDWYMIELSALFLISALLIATFDWKSSNQFIDDYLNGTKDLLSVGLIIALSGGVGVVLATSGMGDIIVDALTNSLGSLHPIWFIILIFLIFLLISFLIPSSSAFAKAVFPIVAPVASSIKMLSLTILAYSFASGIINLVSPTSGYFMAILMLTNVKWSEYVKTIKWCLLTVTLVCLVLLIIGTQLPPTIA